MIVIVPERGRLRSINFVIIFASQLRRIMNIIKTECKAGLIGRGIQASLTPAMHMEEGRVHGVHYQYELLDVAERSLENKTLEHLLSDAEAGGLSGVNVTHPFKQVVLDYLDELSEDARALGAVNTVVFRDGKRIGYNTDWWGFSESFQLGLPRVDVKSVVQLGAGGAGAATAYAILKLGAEKLTVFEADQEKARGLISGLAKLFPKVDLSVGEDLGAAMEAASGLIHATPIGMAAYPGMPLSADLLRSTHWVSEVVYFPLETELVQSAKAKGCSVLNGGGMAVYQAVGAFELFSGLKADRARMTAHFMKLTGQSHE